MSGQLSPAAALATGGLCVLRQVSLPFCSADSSLVREEGPEVTGPKGPTQGLRVRIITAVVVTDLTIKGGARKGKGDRAAEIEALSDLQEISSINSET